MVSLRAVREDSPDIDAAMATSAQLSRLYRWRQPFTQPKYALLDSVYIRL